MTPATAGRAGRRAETRRIAIVGVSGPDGAGKSGLVRRLQARLKHSGRAVTSTYLYGCVICRRLPPAAGARVRQASRSPDQAPLVRTTARTLRALHALADAAELALRLAVASMTLRFTARGRHERRYLLTDRSPLDGLVKHSAGAGSAGAAVFRRIAGRYDLILLLQAPPAVLAERDGEHEEHILAAALQRFEASASGLPNVARIDTLACPPDALAEVAEALIGATLDPDRVVMGAMPGGRAANE